MKPQELQPGNLISSIPGGNDWDATFIEEVMPTGVKIEVLYRLRRTPTTLTVCKNPGHGGFIPFTSSFWNSRYPNGVFVFAKIPRLIGHMEITIEYPTETVQPA